MFETTYGMTGHFRLPGLTLATNLTDFAKSMEITTFSGPWKLSTAVSTQIWGANIGDNWCSYPSLYGDSWEGSRFQHVDKRIIAFRFCIHIWEFSYFTCQFMTVAPIILQLSPSPPKTGHFWGGYSNFMSYKNPWGDEAWWRFIVSSSSYWSRIQKWILEEPRDGGSNQIVGWEMVRKFYHGCIGYLYVYKWFIHRNLGSMDRKYCWW